MKAADNLNYGAVVGHLMELAWACEHWGEIADARGEYKSACAHLEESLGIFRELGFLRFAASVLCKLGRVARHQCQWSAATAHLCESLAFWRQDGDQQGIAACLIGLARVALGQGRPARAARLLGTTEPLWSEDNHPQAHCVREQVVAAVRAGMAPAEFEAEWAAGQAAPLEQIIAEALEEAPTG